MPQINPDPIIVKIAFSLLLPHFSKKGNSLASNPIYFEDIAIPLTGNHLIVKSAPPLSIKRSPIHHF